MIDRRSYFVREGRTKLTADDRADFFSPV